jgi:uncharacterized protein YkwD
MLRKMAVGLACFVGAGLFMLLVTSVGVAADKTVTWSFTNGTDGDTELFWLDNGNDKEVSYGVVPKGQSKGVETYKGEVWIVRSAKGDELARYTVDTPPGTTEAAGLNGPQADLVRKKDTSGHDTAATDAQIIHLTNQERQKAGLAPLVEDAKLADVAKKYAELMARQQKLDHRLGGTSPGDRLTAAGYHWSSYAENIAENYADAGAAVQGWMNSPGHRANILKPNVTQIGVGVAYSSAGVPYYCQVFAQPQ